MIKLEIDVRDIDYDSLIDRFLPVVLEKLRQSENTASRMIAGGMPAPVAKAILKNLPQATKEQLAAELLSSNKEAVIQYLSDMAGQNGIRLNIGDLRAKTASG
ncbi:MAG: hypothetical protein GX847_12430 [Clostridiales bacterium]|nr:hypothetical protein [Clostridiales bacterium]